MRRHRGRRWNSSWWAWWYIPSPTPTAAAQEVLVRAEVEDRRRRRAARRRLARELVRATQLLWGYPLALVVFLGISIASNHDAPWNGLGFIVCGAWLIHYLMLRSSRRGAEARRAQARQDEDRARALAAEREQYERRSWRGTL